MTDIATQAMGLAGTPEGSGPASAATWARLWERVGPADLVPPSDAGRVDKLVKLVGENKELQEAYRNWDKLAKEQRLGALRLIADLFADAYGIPKFELDSFEPAEKEERVLAFHRFDGRMMVNASALDDRDAAVSAVMHQGLHRYQDDLMAAVAAGRIGPDDDRYRLSFVLGANKTNYLGSQDYAAYRGQPIEGQAYLMEGVGAAALAALTGADAPPRVTLNRITRKAAVGMSVGPTGLLFPAYLLAAFLIVLAMVVIVFRAETGGLGPRTS